ncbi:T5orf172 domain protein [Azoarcus sp. Aa7]|nr:T5orf172 domain protein [Azoarcus sp. Aa7]
MTGNESTTRMPVVGQMHVYVLPTRDGTRIKIGRSRNPLDRIAGLITIYPDIDLGHAVVVAVDCHRIETVLHTVFDLRRRAQAERKDGYTEWFDGNFVEEALALLEAVASHRGTTYPVFRGVETLVADYVMKNPNAGLRAPRMTNAERNARRPIVEALLREALVERAQRIVDLLDERTFDAVVRHRNGTYLVRTIRREEEPECWLADGTFQVSEWGKALVTLADADMQVDGGKCRIRMLDLPCFVSADADHGQEFYRINRDEPSDEAPHRVSVFQDDAAFAELWSAFRHLPVIESPTDPLFHPKGSNRI